MQSSATKTVNEKVIELENNCNSAKQVANGYFYKWTKTKEENSRLLYSASSNFKEEIPKSMIIKRDLLEVKGDKILGTGTFWSGYKGKYKDRNVCLKFFNEKHFLRSNLINELKAMLNLIPHSCLPLLFGIRLEPDAILITQFIGFKKERVSFCRRLKTMKLSQSC